jgi:hypothetical protein
MLCVIAPRDATPLDGHAACSSVSLQLWVQDTVADLAKHATFAKHAKSMQVWCCIVVFEADVISPS